MATYGSRMSEFCLDEELLVKSSKGWPYYINAVMLGRLSQSVDLVEQLETASFHNRVIVFRVYLSVVG